MKQLLALTLLAWLPVLAWAQEHITFMGHNVDEPDIVQALVKEKKIKESVEGVYAGQFAGNAMLFQFVGDPIRGISVSSMEKEWTELKRMYHQYKELFSEKYELMGSVEKTGVTEEYEVSLALSKIRTGEGKYASIFRIPNGKVTVSIEAPRKVKYPKVGYLIILYVDDPNQEAYKAAKTKKNLEDI